jgi:hypothetical protein
MLERGRFTSEEQMIESHLLFSRLTSLADERNSCSLGRSCICWTMLA